MVDLASPDAADQCQTVEDILGDLELLDKPRITALNKIDLVLSSDRAWDEASALEYLADRSMDKNTALVSATRRWGLSGLLELVSETLVGISQFS